MSFNREYFADLLLKAKGGRSINSFGASAGVDPGYISRLLRGLVVNAPSASVINRLAAAQNNVSAAELMCAAGYLEPSEAPIYHHPTRHNHIPQEWEQVIEEAARYNISPELAADLIRSLGQSLEKARK